MNLWRVVLIYHSPIVCEVKKLNLIEVYNKIADDVAMLIDIKIKNINRDITFKATVIEKVSDTKYKILYKKQYHTAWCLAKLVIGSTVHVCAPGNDWSELFINQSCTRKEFEELKSDLTTLVEYTVTLGTTQSTQTLGGYYASIPLGFVNGATYRVVVCSCFLATNAAIMGASHSPSGSNLLYVNGNASGGTYKVQLLKIAL